MENKKQRKPKAPAKKPIHPPLYHGSEERRFPLESADGRTLYMTVEDVSELAQQILFQAMLPGHKKSVEEEFDEHGNVISETTTTEHVPGDWRAAAKWLQLQAQGAIN